MKTLYTFISLLFVSLLSYAQLTNDGYYRVKNTNTGYYVYIMDNTGSVNVASTSADMGAIRLYNDTEKMISDPASVIYFQKHGSQWDFQSQGTGLYKLLSFYVDVKGTQPYYQLYAQKNGWTLYLVDDGDSDYGYNQLGTASGTGNRTWTVDPISTESATNYFGIKPTIECNGKYYAPFYAAFPFSIASSKMKAYTIDRVEKNVAIIKEITQKEIPAATPVIFECESNNPADNKLNLLTGNYPAVNGALKGVYFYHDRRSASKSKDARTNFDANTMRVLSVKDGKLIYTNDTEGLPYNTIYTPHSYCLKANESYLPVAEGTDAELAIMTEKEYEESKPKNYTLTVNAEHGSIALNPAPVDGTYEEGTSVAIYAVPAEGYSFKEWSDGTNANPYNYTVTSNAILTAQFSLNSYKVTYMAGGNVVSSTSVEYGSQIPSEVAPTREGYTFAGWSGTQYSTMPAFDIYYSAIYNVNSYKVYYYSDNELVHEETVEYGSTIPDFTVSKDGFNFAGWVGKDTYMPAHDVTLNALFVEKDKRTVSVESLHGNVSITPAAENNVYVEGTTITISVTPEEGFEFNSWSNGSTENPLSITLTEDLKLSAIFTPKNYTVSYYDGETLIGTQSVACGSAIPEYEAPAKEGYTFYAWNGEAFDAMPAKDINYTAIYTVNSYKVMYYVDDELVNTVSVVYGDPIPVYEYKKEGWIFKGWDGEEATTMPARDLQYTAIFEADAIVPTFVKGNAVNVYTITGTCVKRNVTAEDVKSLPTGLYIINGKKVVIR